MTLTKLFKSALKELEQLGCAYAVAGGFAADLYRYQERGTTDIDFLFLTNGFEKERGKELLAKLDLKGREAKEHDLKRNPRMNKKKADVFILVGRKSGESQGVDLLLPPFPWFEKAISRAQSNQIDFNLGSGPVPTITAEDVILAKLYAGRLKDKDDILSIFQAHTELKVKLDLNYLISEMNRLKLNLPEEVRSEAPKALRVLARRKKQSKKSFP